MATVRRGKTSMFSKQMQQILSGEVDSDLTNAVQKNRSGTKVPDSIKKRRARAKRKAKR